MHGLSVELQKGPVAPHPGVIDETYKNPPNTMLMTISSFFQNSNQNKIYHSLNYRGVPTR